MSGQPADQTLLFAVLAYQNTLISREDLRGVVGPTDDLNDTVLQNNTLPSDDLQLLKDLAKTVLNRHGGDLTKSIEAISTLNTSLPDELTRLGQAGVEATLSVSPSTTEGRLASPLSSPRDESTPSRYRLLKPHARGGLGEVFVGQDTELNRQVAVKEIQARFSHDLESRARFTLEAEVTGGLEHPGIVPVYGLGTYADGRPYYAMRFIQGDSLEEAIKQFHGESVTPSPAICATGPFEGHEGHDKAADQQPSTGHAAGNEPSRAAEFDRLELRRLIGRFNDVCNAIHYAHSRGVLHRDLKPGNIMLGKYGETLVVDWGLAKIAGREHEPAIAAETTLQPSSASGAMPTQFGSAHGTPAYMPPEQAAGQLDKLGPASDVYSLGATLYHLLTGRPPLTGPDVVTVLKKVQSGEFPAPRQVKPEIPRALEAICLKAMATQPQDRYPTPQALAEDLESYLADEPVEAHPEPLLWRARRWLRKHPKTVSAIAATLLIGLTSATLVSAVVTGKNRQLEEVNDDLLQANASERKANQEARARQAEAEKARSQASAAATAERAAKDALLVSFQSTRNFQGAIEFFETDWKRCRRNLGENHAQTLASAQNLAAAYGSAGKTEEAVKLFEDTLQRRRATLGDDHPNTLMSMKLAGVQHRAAKDFEKAIPVLEVAVKGCRKKLGDEDPDTLMTIQELGITFKESRQIDQALPLFEEAVAGLLKQFGPQHPQHHHGITAMRHLSAAYVETQDPVKAVASYEDLLRRVRAMLGNADSTTLSTMNELAGAYQAADQLPKAIELLEEELSLRKTHVGESDPMTLLAMHNLGAAYLNIRDLEKAVPLLENTVQRKKETLGGQDKDTLATMEALGHALHLAGRPADAVAPFRESYDAKKATLGAGNPETMASLNALAVTLLMAKQPESALPLFEEYIAGHRSAATDQAILANALASVGAHLLQHQEFPRAKELLAECLEIRQNGPPGLQLEEAKSLLGSALAGDAKRVLKTDKDAAAQQFAEAERMLRGAYEIIKRNMSQIPPAARPQAVAALTRLIDFYETRGGEGDANQAARLRAELPRWEAPTGGAK